MTPRSILACCAVWCTLPASALLIRADRDDAEYLELASRYAASIPLAASGGEGALVAPRWVLTSAHRAKDFSKPGAKLAIAGETFAVQSVFTHPAWKGGADDDVALLLLAQPVTTLEPRPLHKSADEAGRAAVLVGHGHSARPGGKAATDDRRARAGINTIEDLRERRFTMRAKQGDDASDLQAVPVPAQTGGAAYLESGDDIRVAGILVAVEDGRSTYARVSAYAPWIEAQMLSVAIREAEALLDDGSRR